MIKVMFVCHGNICRSPMAEFVLKDMVEKQGIADNFYIVSSATSTDEIGEPVHYGTRNKLKNYNISVEGKVAVQLKKTDYDKYDYFLCMDTENIYYIKRILGEDSKNKIFKLLDFSKMSRDIADPWYTANFDLTYDDIVEGCMAFLKYLNN